MVTFISILIGVLASVGVFFVILLTFKVRIIAVMITALLPVIAFILSLILIDITRVNLSVVITGTIIGIGVSAILSYLLKNKYE